MTNGKREKPKADKKAAAKKNGVTMVHEAIRPLDQAPEDSERSPRSLVDCSVFWDTNPSQYPPSLLCKRVAAR